MCKHRYFVSFAGPTKGRPPEACPSPANTSIVALYERCPKKRNATIGRLAGANACRRIVKRHASLAEYVCGTVDNLYSVLMRYLLSASFC